MTRRTAAPTILPKATKNLCKASEAPVNSQWLRTLQTLAAICRSRCNFKTLKLKNENSCDKPAGPESLNIRLKDKILHDLIKDPKLWELWYIPYYG